MQNHYQSFCSFVIRPFICWHQLIHLSFIPDVEAQGLSFSPHDVLEELISRRQLLISFLNLHGIPPLQPFPHVDPILFCLFYSDLYQILHFARNQQIFFFRENFSFWVNLGQKPIQLCFLLHPHLPSELTLPIPQHDAYVAFLEEYILIVDL